jgi:pre-mRNA-splicing factor ATP-dependent RNA helicase DHX16
MHVLSVDRVLTFEARAQSLTRVRDIRDQLVNLCERVEIFVEGNTNSSDILPIQKAICAG